MIEKHIQKLNFNPFFTGLIFQAFYEGYEKKTCPLILHYLISPIIMFKETRNLFTSITKNAVLDKIVESNAISFLDLQYRIWKMKEHTNQSLINLHNTGKIELKNDINIIETINYVQYDDTLKSHIRSSHYLGILFKEFEVHEIYKIFKVIP